MNPTPQIEVEFYELMGVLREGTISEEQKTRLDVLLGRYPAMQKAYVDYVLLWHELRHYQPLSEVERASVTRQMDVVAIEREAQRRLDRFLAEQEKMRRLQQQASGTGLSADLVDVVRGWLSSLRRVAAFGVFLAALVFAGAMVVQHVRPGPVASLADSMNAQWDAVPDGSLSKNMPLHTGSFTLQQGYARIVFQKGASVWIEAPAEFRLKSSKRMILNSGRVFAEVPPAAKGFAVLTHQATVVDLGTQFGITTSPSGTSDLHMFKGQASLTPTAAGQTDRGQTLTAGRAGSVDSAGILKDIQIDNGAFVRRFFPRSSFVWKGQAIDLADVVGGGNGFGTGQLNRWIEINTGRDGTGYVGNKRATQTHQTTDNRYHRVAHVLYVDGVFSPDANAGPVQVSSQEHLWRDCPKTSGRFFEDIFNGDYISVGANSHGFVLEGQAFGSREHPAIALHSNAGITFDLDAMRRDMPGLEIVKFEAQCGISEDVRPHLGGTQPVTVDFWVLVDGKKRFKAIGMTPDSKPQKISVPLSRRARFLTLVTTDGDGRPNYDWSFFAEPHLEVQTVQ